jgi:hypothetical protein
MIVTRTHAGARARARLLVVAALTVVTAAFASVAVHAAAAPTAFSLRFEGLHVPDAALSHGLRHDGRFTALPPFCAAGRAYDVRHFGEDSLSVHRLHTCDDGSGSFTAFMPNVLNEHRGQGAWRIVEGTGRYATLRGFGTYRGTLLGGDPLLFDTITYRTDWQGAVGFDADPPALESLAVTARKLPLRQRTYVVQVALVARDQSAPVSYTVEVRTGSADVVSKLGSTSSGRAAITFRIRPARAVRSARIELTAQDALGNAMSATRSVQLR